MGLVRSRSVSPLLRRKKNPTGFQPRAHILTLGRDLIVLAAACCGVFTLVAVASARATDPSLNASAQAAVHNLVGIWGAAWADLLRQSLGLAAYALAPMALGLGLVAAARAAPGLAVATWAVGGVAVLVSSALCGELAWPRPVAQPAVGGVVGLLLARTLRPRLGLVGAWTLGGVGLAVGSRLLWIGLSGAQRRPPGAARGLAALWGACRRAGGWAAQPQPSGLPQLAAGPADLAAARLPGAGADPATETETHDGSRAGAEAELAAQPRAGASVPASGSAAASPGAEPARLLAAASGAAMAAVLPAARRTRDALPPTRDARLVEPISAEPPVGQAHLPPRAALWPAAEGRSADSRAVAPPDPSRAAALVAALRQHGVEGQIAEVRPGPVVTLYAFTPTPGTKLAKVAGLAGDLALSLAAMRVRVVAPIPGTGQVGFEIANPQRSPVSFGSCVRTPTFAAAIAAEGLPLALGQDIGGRCFAACLTRMPHLLMAGATGSGKSVALNALLVSLLLARGPDRLRLVLIDPKKLELAAYRAIPHLLMPVVTESARAAAALQTVLAEMDRRYAVLAAAGARHLAAYNQALPAGAPPLPYIVVVIDELADLMTVATQAIEQAVLRLAQMARAAGIHLILATQRPSVDVLTGVIKANLPARIAFQVASVHDARTILDGPGAEHLLGHGDMLLRMPGAGSMLRLHGGLIEPPEIERVAAFWRQAGAGDKVRCGPAVLGSPRFSAGHGDSSSPGVLERGPVVARSAGPQGHPVQRLRRAEPR